MHCVSLFSKSQNLGVCGRGGGEEKRSKVSLCVAGHCHHGNRGLPDQVATQRQPHGVPRLGAFRAEQRPSLPPGRKGVVMLTEAGSLTGVWVPTQASLLINYVDPGADSRVLSLSFLICEMRRTGMLWGIKETMQCLDASSSLHRLCYDPNHCPHGCLHAGVTQAMARAWDDRADRMCRTKDRSTQLVWMLLPTAQICPSHMPFLQGTSRTFMDGRVPCPGVYSARDYSRSDAV